MSDVPFSSESALPEDYLSSELARMRSQDLLLKSRYGFLDDADALLLLALGRALGPSRLDQVFYEADCASLAPHDVGYFLAILFKSLLLVDDPEYAKSGAYFLKERSIWYSPGKLAYRVVPDHLLGAGIEAHDHYFINRSYTNGPSLRLLWLAYARSDCVAYLVDQMNCYNINIPQEDWPNIWGCIETALCLHSVAEIWSVIWMAVRDVDTLSRHRYYNSKRAADMLPSKLLRYFEKAKKGEILLKAWNRSPSQPGGSLGQIFYEFFGINENTPGAQIAEIFASKKKSDEEGFGHLTDDWRDAANDAVCRALESGLAPEMLFAFAKAIRQGASISDALFATIDEYGELQPPLSAQSDD